VIANFFLHLPVKKLLMPPSNEPPMLKGLAKEPDPGHNQLQIKVAQK
jgi:hypothetical protein